MKEQQIPTEPEVVEFYNEVVEIIDEFVDAAVLHKKNLKIATVIDRVAEMIDVQKNKLVRFLNLFNCRYTTGVKKIKFVMNGTLVSDPNFYTIKGNALRKLSKNKRLQNEFLNQ